MNRKSYLKIVKALVELLVVIMTEIGRVPVANAYKVGSNVMKAIVGETPDQVEKDVNKK